MDPLNPLFLVQKKLYQQNKLFVPIDHHAKFKIFKLSFCGSDKKCQNKSFKKPLFGALPKIVDWIRKYVQICDGF